MYSISIVWRKFAYIGQVGELNLQLHVCDLWLRADCHGDNLGVHGCVIPAQEMEIRQRAKA